MKYFFYLSLLFSLLLSCGAEATQTVPSGEIVSETTEETTNEEVVVAEEIADTLAKAEEISAIKENNTSTAKTSEIKTTEAVKEVKKETDKKEVITEIVEVVETIDEPIPVPLAEKKPPLHDKWDELVSKYVSSSGKVNYSGFVGEKQKIDSYITDLKDNYSDLKSWNRNKRLAYWINMYNAVTVKLIVDNHPVTSITKLKGGKPWDAKLITLGGTQYTLNQIENEIIRPRFKEPRIHFAVNCAAKSCPKIMNKAWTEDNMSRYLTKQTKAFLTNAGQNTITADKITVSKIFDWYKADFGNDNEGLIKFINTYSDVKVNSTAVVEFNEYDWALNN